jgi:hypothetical protein
MSPELRIDASLLAGEFEYTFTRNSQDPALSAWHIRFYQTLNVAGPYKSAKLAMGHICALTGPESLVRDFLSWTKSGRINQDFFNEPVVS